MRLYAACAERANNVSQAAMMADIEARSGGAHPDMTRGRSEADWGIRADALEGRANEIARSIGKGPADVSALRLAESLRLSGEQQQRQATNVSARGLVSSLKNACRWPGRSGLAPSAPSAWPALGRGAEVHFAKLSHHQSMSAMGRLLPVRYGWNTVGPGRRVCLRRQLNHLPR